jgi:glycosyltransferase involved in cell wall biosynthesis
LELNILLLTNELRYTCGVTNHLLHLTEGLSKIKGNKLWIICGGGNGIDRFKDIKVKIITDERFLHQLRNLKHYASAIKFLISFILKNKIDILHSHSHYAASIAFDAARFTGTVTIQTNHGLIGYEGFLKHFRAKKYIAINEHIYDYLVQNKIAFKKNISFIRCGIPVPDSIPSKDINRLKVVAATRFIYEKGLDIYIEAVSKLDKDTKSKAEFFLAGDGELRSDLLIMNKEKGGNISYLGNLLDINDILELSHILVYPSRSSSEGFPAIITEAGANGLVVISSDFPGVGSVIKNNTDGIIFKMDDAADLTKKLTVVISKYDNYIPASKNLYSKIKDWFSLEKMINKHRELYTSCLKG